MVYATEFCCGTFVVVGMVHWLLGSRKLPRSQGVWLFEAAMSPPETCVSKLDYRGKSCTATITSGRYV